MKTLILSVSLFFAIASGLGARTIKFPEKHPVFSFTLPDGWTTEPSGKDGSGLECKAPGKPKYSFLLRPIPSKTEKDVKTGLAELLPTLENSDMKDFKAGEVEQMTVGKMKVFVIKATALLAGDPMVLRLMAFAPKKGTYFTTFSMAWEKGDAAHVDVMREILGSVKPISGESAG